MSTWNIKGVSPSARETVKRMAARHDQNAGQWLEQTIRQSIAHQRLERRRTLMKQLLHQIEQQQLLQNEFQNRYDWLSDRLAETSKPTGCVSSAQGFPCRRSPPHPDACFVRFFQE
jgi:predicted XRE-type DNA-binding protein